MTDWTVTCSGAVVTEATYEDITVRRTCEYKASGSWFYVTGSALVHAAQKPDHDELTYRRET